MRLLAVLPSVPVPADTGGTLRTLNLVRALDQAFELTVLAPLLPHQDLGGFERLLRGRVVAVPERAGRSVPAELQALVTGRPFGYRKFASPKLTAAMEKLVAETPFDAVHFDHVHTAQLLPRARALLPNALLVVDQHNVEALILERLAEVSKLHLRPVVSLQASRVRRLEESLMREADLVTACSAIDAEQLRAMGARQVEVVPNGVSLKFSAPDPAEKRKDVVFVGSMDWWPNVEAADRLVREIWPVVRKRLPGTRLVIVGRNPPAALKALAARDVVVTGSVPSVEPYLKAAFATAIPLRAGSGTRLKVLEACAARVPVVATRIATEGLPLEDDRELLFADAPEEYARALVRLRDEPGLCERLTGAALSVAAEFDWDAVGAKLVQLYRERLAKPSSPQAAAEASPAQA